MQILYKLKVLFAFFALFLLIGLSSIAAQDKKDLSNTARQIILNVTVTNEKDELITGLKAENFKVYDEKTLQTIMHFETKDEPSSIGILFDVSESTKDSALYKVAFKALARFVELSNPDNEYFLTAFNEKQQLLLDTTQNINAVIKAFTKLPMIKPEGGTFLFDALYSSLEKVSQGRHKKKVLIIVSDGNEHDSKKDFGDINRALKKSDVLVYAISNRTPESQLYPDQQPYLDIITNQTGGKVYYSSENLREDFLEKEVKGLLAMVATQLSSHYTIGFQPGETIKNGKKEKWRNLKVKIELPPDISRRIGKIYVRTREGYYSGNTSTK